MNIPSRLLENAVQELSGFPGVGKRTALRFALHLLKKSKQDVERLGNAVVALRNEIKYCQKCCNIAEAEYCDICSDQRRDKTLICVVQDIRDVMAIEQTSQYKGLYHVLGGLISPMDG